jgi:hypothetical protein
MQPCHKLGRSKLAETSRPPLSANRLLSSFQSGPNTEIAFRAFTVSLAYITRPGGGWRRSRESQSCLR